MDKHEFYTQHKERQEKTWGQYNSLRPDNTDPRSAANITARAVLDLHNINSLLDIGCGPLVFLDLLKGKVKDLYGVDIAEYSVWKSEKDILTRMVDIDKEGIPFESSLFDCVTMLATLEHLFDPFNAVKEAHRVLKPGGYYIFSVPNIAGIKHRVDLCFGKLPVTSFEGSWQEKEWDGGHLHYFTLDSLRWLLDISGPFRIINVKGSGKFQWLKSIYPAFFSQDLIITAVKEPGK